MQPADRGLHVFAYSGKSIWMMRACCALSSLTGPAIYLCSRPRPVGGELWWIAAFALAFSGVFFLMLRACECYRVEVNTDGIVHFRLRSPLRHAFQGLGSMALLESGGRGPTYVLALYDKRGRCVDTFADPLENFTGLVALTKEYAFAMGIPYRYRDKWGAWTR